jgi:hypothetical protein
MGDMRWQMWVMLSIGILVAPGEHVSVTKMSLR